MSEDLVRHSRAGDVFHYRWAARRCLKLIYPDTTLRKVVIEGSTEDKKAGEYVIDVSEYYKSDTEKSIKYYQLKHSDLQLEKPFTLGGLKKTIEGFAKRYIQHSEEQKETTEIIHIDFSVITNRPIDATVKNNFQELINKQPTTGTFKSTLEKYTNLKGEQLINFCKILNLEDGHGDYDLQKEELRIELSQVLAGTIDNEHVDTIEALVKEKALPAKQDKGVIVQEDILKRFHFTSLGALFPAPPKWEKLGKSIVRKQYLDLKNAIIEQDGAFIVHAGGGVGKSVFTRQFESYIEEGSLAIAYDCFGAGTYRSRSSSRHWHRDALVQISNELASKGLCSPLLAQNSASAAEIMRMFMVSINKSLEALKKAEPTAKLFILIDAADNAEMAAKQFDEDCFAHELLGEIFPPDCKIILLCRTERIDLLKPKSNTIQLPLEPFSQEESLANLQTYFSDATTEDGQEFHRRTAGNPRVQANALDFKYESIELLLHSLAPTGTTVEDQINLQLQNAVNRVKQTFTEDYEKYVDSICLGLASLPPFIPINVLAEVAEVKPDFVRSFVADIGRSIWLIDSSVQFIDEPTETWFRKTFAANRANYIDYINKLEPLAENNAYVAATLPQLYLEAGEESKLIEIALSDKFLPKNNQLDERTVRVYRLQFAFKAALRTNRLKDAAILGMRAGEEVAGDARQLSLLIENTDLFVALQDNVKVQEVGFRRLLKSVWDGSENLYSASLFSAIPEFQGDARVFIRSALNWLEIYIEEHEKKKAKDRHPQFDITEQDFLEFSYTILNLDGIDAAIAFLKRLNKGGAFFTIKALSKRLIEQNRFEDLENILLKSETEIYFILPIVQELFEVGRLTNSKILSNAIKLLKEEKDIIGSDTFRFDNPIIPSVVDFIECCVSSRIQEGVLEIIEKYFPLRTTQKFTSDHDGKERVMYLKVLALRLLLGGIADIDFDQLIPTVFLVDKKYENERRVSEYKEFTNGLIPWYRLRAKIFAGTITNISNEFKSSTDESKKALGSRYRQFDPIPSEIVQLQVSILKHYKNLTPKELELIYKEYIAENKAFYLPARIDAAKAASFLPHLLPIRHLLESSAANVISNDIDDGPEKISGYYVALARAVIAHSKLDAAVYFNRAIEVVSKFGDEIGQRWYAVSSLANVTSNGAVPEEIAYRFIRCAEVVGENMREKHWSRSEALVICSRLHTGAGISALSRWRDRDIGYFARLTEKLIIELLNKDKIDACTGWALTRFLPNPHLNEIAKLCFEKEVDYHKKQFIIDDYVKLLSNHGCDSSYWVELNKICLERSIANPYLSKIINHYSKATQPEKTKSTIGNRKELSIDWGLVFADCDILSATGLNTAHKYLKETLNYDGFGLHSDFWTQVFSRIREDDIFKLIDAVLVTDFVGFYDFKDFIQHIPENLKNKVSFKNKWSEIVLKISYAFAYELINSYTLSYFTEAIAILPIPNDAIKEGVVSKLSTSNEFNNAEVFFGFVALISQFLSPQEAIDVLEYAIKRFEIHIDNEFADGDWQTSLTTNPKTDNSIAGLIWSALASPRAYMRWNAVHAVILLVQLNCTNILDELLNWLNSGKVGAFGSARFPFYNLHARLYLLIALSRASLDSVEYLKKQSNLISKLALEPHSLIQKFSLDIINNIESAYPGNYPSTLLSEMRGKIVTEKPIKKIKWGETIDTPRHKKGKIKRRDVLFAHDFDRYWFEPLGDVFGVSGDQIEDLAADVLVNEWGRKKEESGFYQDPRSGLWNGSSERETWHSHGDYPRTDNLDFYYSYHSMFVVSARLVKEMNVVVSRDETFNPWDNWLSDHLLTRKNGKLLSELRDPLPINRPEWVGKDKPKTWINRLTDNDFINRLIFKNQNETWVNFCGEWTEIDNYYKETVSVCTSLVDTRTSNSLMNAVNASNDPYDYYLPHYEGSDGEIDDPPFILRGLIEERHSSKGLDEYDPYANEIGHPPMILGENISKQLCLTVDENEKNWYLPNNVNPSVVCENWNSPTDWKDKEPDQSGHRLRATLPMMLDMCKQTNCDLIIEVSIKRTNSLPYRDEKEPYKHPTKKIFILSSNGELKDAKRNYRLR